MDILYLLIPLSALMVLLLIGVFGWALHRGQFDDLEHEGARILQNDASLTSAVATPFDAGQAAAAAAPEQSPQRKGPMPQPTPTPTGSSIHP